MYDLPKVRDLALLLFLAHLLVACSSDDTKPLPPATTAQAPLLDTVQSRQQMALKVLEAYPISEWGSDILARMQLHVGPEVTAAFQEKVRDQVSEEQIQQLRIKLLTNTFTASELSSLAELYRDRGTRALLRKLPNLEDQLRDEITPLVVESLSGKASTAP